MKTIEMKRGGIHRVLPLSKKDKFLAQGYEVVQPAESEKPSFKNLKEEEIRKQAKEKGIKSTHNKKIENIIEELEELGVWYNG